MTWFQGEFNGDGKVDINDLTIVLSNYGHTVGLPLATATVPEPGAANALAASVVGLSVFGWWKA